MLYFGHFPSGLQALTAITVAPAATPTTSVVLSFAAITPATRVPCPCISSGLSPDMKETLFATST